MHFSIGLISGDTAVPDMVRLAQQAEATGYHTFWISEDYFYGGAFATAAACACATGSIRLGIGVLNPYTRHPVLTAMEAGSLDAAAHGRLVLGLGASNPRWIQEMAGIPYRKAVPILRETVKILRGLIAGEIVNHDGDNFHVHDVQLDFQPVRRSIPIHLGVKAPATLALAGAVADGVLLSTLSSAPYVRWAVERIRSGAQRAGRESLDGFEVGAYLLIYPDPDRQKAREAVRPLIARYLGLHGYHPILLESGLSEEEIRPFREAYLAKESAAGLVDDRLIDLFSVAGTPEECRERLRLWTDAGVTHICAKVPGNGAAELMQSIAKHLM